MKIKQEFSEFAEGLRQALPRFVDWACWRWMEIVIVCLISVTAFLVLQGLAVSP